MQSEFMDKVVVVTGANRGMGLQIAKAFAARGAKTVLVGRDAQVMDWFTRLVPERAMTMIADRMASLLQR